MEDVIKKVQSLKKEIEAAQKEVSELEGGKNQLLKQLKDGYGIDNIDDAEQQLIKMEEEMASLESSIQEAYLQLQKDYVW